MSGDRLRIVHIIDTIGKPASGPSYAVPRLCEALADLGHDVELHAVRNAGGVPVRVPVVTYGGPRALRYVGASAGLQRALPEILATADIVHGHGVWMLPNITPFLPKRSAATRVLSPHGMLLPPAAAYRRWRKRASWHLGQGRALRNVDLFHATSAAETESIRDMGLGPVVTIPNGIDLPDLPADRPSRENRTVLYLGRLHPIKGIDMLLAAWAEVEAEHPDWELVIAGPSAQQTRERLEAQAAVLQTRSVRFVGPMYGPAKAAAYATADLFVLPSRSENFGVTVLEALAQRVPVMATTTTPWSPAEDEGCGWSVEPRVIALKESLTKALSLPISELAAMGERGRQWVARTYDWPTLARRMEVSYHNSLGTRPSEG